MEALRYETSDGIRVVTIRCNLDDDPVFQRHDAKDKARVTYLSVTRFPDGSGFTSTGRFCSWSENWGTPKSVAFARCLTWTP